MNASLRELVDRWKNRIMPRSRLRLDTEVEHASSWISTWSGETMWQVEHVHTIHSFIFYTSKRMCTCNLWELISIPCRHEVFALGFKNQRPKEFMDDYYSKDTYMAYYSFNVSPIDGQDSKCEKHKKGAFELGFLKSKAFSKTKTLVTN